MKSNVVKLPTAATSYYLLRKAGRHWILELVTPAPGKPLRTKLVTYGDRDFAIEDAQATAARVLRPLKIGRTV